MCFRQFFPSLKWMSTTGYPLAKVRATLARLRNDSVTKRSQDAIVATLKSIIDDRIVTISLRNRASVTEPLDIK